MESTVVVNLYRFYFKALSGENTKKIKFLILRFSSIGDIVLTTPVVRCLKQQIPNAEIHYCTKKSFIGLLNQNPYIDKIWSLEDDIQLLIQDLRKENFDYIIDLHHNLRTFWIKANLWQVPAYSFSKLNIQKWLYVRFKWQVMPNMHIVDRYLKTVESLGVQSDGKGLDFFIAPHEEVNLKDVFPNLSPQFAAFVIGAKFNTKQLPADMIAHWCKHLNMPIVLMGGKEDVAKGAEICKMLPNEQVFDAVGKFNLQGSASILKQASVVLTHDTGLMHIAAAFHKKMVTFWGNTTPQLGMYPYQVDQVTYIENKELVCRPCSKIGFNACPKGHFNCMKALTPDKFPIAL